MKVIYIGLLLSIFTTSLNAQSIGDFVSIRPETQTEQLVIPSTHIFQSLIQTGIVLPDGSVVQVFPDFTGYIPTNGSSTEGHLSVNYEALPGGVSVYDIKFNEVSRLWEITGSKNIDFTLLGGSGFNCSGGITPWGTSITSEEPQPSINTIPGPLNDLNQDGYVDLGWNTEIDPITKTIVDQDGDGDADKLWKMGLIKHENVTVNAAGTILYQGADDGDFGFVFKYVPTVRGKLGDGKLYFLKMDGGQNDIYTAGGRWVLVPNTTQEECNSVQTFAADNGATNFKRVEDVEVGPDSMIYFAATSPGNVYRFKDAGEVVSDFSTWVQKGNYPIESSAATDSVKFEKCDNLVFDCDGNLWVTEDGTSFHVWVIDNNHTPAVPRIRLFMNAPKSVNDPSGNVSGAEPTGLTFTPDCKYGFISLQRCGPGNTATQIDASGLPVVFNRDMTFVFARQEDLGSSGNSIDKNASNSSSNLFPNPASTVVNLTFQLKSAASLTIQVIDKLGRVVGKKGFTGNAGSNLIQCDTLIFPNGTYTIVVKEADKLVFTEKLGVNR